MSYGLLPYPAHVESPLEIVIHRSALSRRGFPGRTIAKASLCYASEGQVMSRLSLSHRLRIVVPGVFVPCLVALLACCPGQQGGAFACGNTPNTHKACNFPLQLAHLITLPPPQTHWLSTTIRDFYPTHPDSIVHRQLQLQVRSPFGSRHCSCWCGCHCPLQRWCPHAVNRGSELRYYPAEHSQLKKSEIGSDMLGLYRQTLLLTPRPSL